MADPRDKEVAEQRVRVVRGITLARKVLIIRETSSGRCSASGGVSAPTRPPVRGIAASRATATAARATSSNEVSRAR